MLYERELVRSQITMEYQFAPRQTAYYVSASEYLGLIERSTTENKHIYCLTPEVRSIMSLPYKRKYLALMKKILERPVFNEAFRVFMNSSNLPDKREIRQIMGIANMLMNDTTIGQRVSAVRSWLKWMLQNVVTE